MQNEHRFLLAIGRSTHNALSHSTTVLKRSSRLCVFVCECPGGSSSGNNPSGSDSDYLSTLSTWEINRIEAPSSGLPRSYRSALSRPVTVRIVLSITSSVHLRHPSSFLCMLCSLLHSVFLLNFLKESREFVVKVCGGERTACAVTFIQCGCY
ncbi:hypothetical protein F2P79_010587 [Pimephales promelas]|nr:hypothetical protein F2P79_010587 [Pimephales promelas]